MRDVAKCTNEDCPVKETCLRWKSEPEEYQVYANFKCNECGCEYYFEEL